MNSEEVARRASQAFFWRVTQHVVGKAIFLLRLVILARLLTPDDFGLMAIAIVATALLMRITDLGMEPALVQRHTTSLVHYDAAWTLGMTRASLVCVTSFVAAPFIAWFFEEPRAVPIIRVLAIGPLLEAATSIRVAELIRELRFRPLAFIRLPNALANTLLAIALAPSLGVWALVAGTLSGSITSLVLSYFLAPHRPRICFQKTAMRSLVRYGRWIFLSGLVTILGTLVLRTVISRELGAAALGLYFLASKLAFLPNELASEIVGSVTFPLYARLQSDLARSARAFRSVLFGISALTVPVYGLMIALSPALVREILGARWEGTAPIIRVLALVGILGLLDENVVPILKGVGEPRRVAAIDGIQTILLIVCIQPLVSLFGVVGAAVAWIPATAGSLILSHRFARKLMPEAFSNSGARVAAVLGISGMGSAVAWTLYNFDPGILALIAAVTTAVTVMAGATWVADRSLSLGLISGLEKILPQLSRRLKSLLADGRTN